MGKSGDYIFQVKQINRKQMLLNFEYDEWFEDRSELLVEFEWEEVAVALRSSIYKRFSFFKVGM